MSPRGRSRSRHSVTAVRHVFLEANPSPMFLGFEARTGLPLTAALTTLLVDV